MDQWKDVEKSGRISDKMVSTLACGMLHNNWRTWLFVWWLSGHVSNTLLVHACSSVAELTLHQNVQKHLPDALQGIIVQQS